MQSTFHFPMKTILLSALLFLVLSCNQSPQKDDTVQTTPQEAPGQPALNGMTEVQAMEKAKLEKIPGEIVSMWHAEEGLGATLYLYQDSTKQLRMRTAFNDGTSMDNPIKTSTQDGKTRYDDDLGKGEYYLVESNGNLGLYGDEGKFDEAIKIVKGQ